MIGSIAGFDHEIVRQLWALLTNMAIRGTVILFLTWMVLRLWRNASAAQAHLVWTIGCISALAVPMLHWAVPVWNVPLLPEATATHGQFDAYLAHAATTTALPGDVVSDANSALPGIPTGQLVLLGMWATFALTALGVLCTGHYRIRRLIHESTPVDDGRILDAAHQWQRALRIRRPVRLIYHSAGIPLTYGTFTPVIVLPADAHEWPDDRLQDVLLHELAHIKRFDGVSQMVVSILCAVQWFNPFAWLAMHRLRDLRETACDNYVLSFGTQPSTYATHLLDLARTIQASRAVGIPALPFLRTKRIERRLYAIIDRRRPRTHVTWRAGIVAGVGGLCLVIPLVAFTPVRQALDPADRANSHPDTLPGRHRVTSTPSPSPPPQPSDMKKALLPGLVGALAIAAPNAHANARPNSDSLMVYAKDLRRASPADSADTVVRVVNRRVSVPSDSTRSGERVSSISELLGARQQQSTPERPARQAGSPLVVLDGKFLTGDSRLDQIDVKTIDRIEVVKGSEAIQRYGEIAEYGAIIITTKKNQ